jgi:hypothetical protein
LANISGARTSQFIDVSTNNLARFRFHILVCFFFSFSLSPSFCQLFVFFVFFIVVYPAGSVLKIYEFFSERNGKNAFINFGRLLLDTGTMFGEKLEMINLIVFSVYNELQVALWNKFSGKTLLFMGKMVGNCCWVYQGAVSHCKTQVGTQVINNSYQKSTRL